MRNRVALRRVATASVVASMIVAATACNSGTSSTPEPTSATSETTQTGKAAAFTGFVEPLSGTKGTVTYQVDLPQLRGGDTAVRERFNSAMHAALNDYLKPTEDNAPVTIAPGQLGDKDTSEVSHIGAGAVAGVLLVNIFVDHAAHPFNEVSTTVIDARTAEPIMITDLFSDVAAGLTRLTEAITAKIAADEKLAGQSAPEPVADQLADWLPAKDGLVVYISVAHVLGDYYPITVGWNDIADVLAPGMQEKLSS